MTDDEMWIGQNGKRYGPYKEADVRQWLQEGKLAHAALGWRDGMAEWAPLINLFPPAAASAPPPPPLFAAAPPSAAAVPLVAGAGDSTTYEPPAAYSVEGVPTTTPDHEGFPAPPSLHWGLVLLFTVLTLGIFGMIWPFIQANWVRKVDQKSSATLLLGIAVACGVVGYILYFAGFAALQRGDTSLGLASFSGLLVIACWVLYLIAYFSMASSLRRNLPEYGLPVAIGGVTLFFFTLYYMQGQLSWIARWKDTGQVSPKASKGIFWVILFIVPFVIGILAGIGISAYQDYVIRAQATGSNLPAESANTVAATYLDSTSQLPHITASTRFTVSKYVLGANVAAGNTSASSTTAVDNSARLHDALVLSRHADSYGHMG